ncbi:MAG TPA: hypothetical protein PKD26_03365 [Pyrinomonadaceae bacterium]|nr:hypothetical protein [Pyrinomonadaceae bacterium]
MDIGRKLLFGTAAPAVTGVVGNLGLTTLAAFNIDISNYPPFGQHVFALLYIY